MNRRLLAAGILSLFLLSNAVCQAASPNGGQSDFQAGIKAFQAGQLHTAQRHFQAARAAGLDTQALHYNLGVVHFRLERYAAAREHFQHLSQFPEVAALAHYNLGLVALGQRYQAEARRHFQRSLDLARETKLHSLALRQLDALAGAAEPTARYGDGIIGLAAGFADNLTLLPEDAALAVDDGFVDVFAAWSGYLHGDRAQGWRLLGNLFHRQYLEEDKLNPSATQIGIRYDRAWNPWWGSLGIAGESVYIGGDFVERRLGPEIELRAPLFQGYWRAYWRYRHIDPSDAYKPYEGGQQRLGLEFRQRSDGWDWRLGYALEHNDRQDLATETEFFSLSPKRHSAQAGLARRLAGHWWLGAGLAYRYSTYADPYLLDTATGPQRQARRDHRTTVSLLLERELFARWRVYTEWQHQLNQSHIDLYDYQRHEVILGFEKFF